MPTSDANIHDIHDSNIAFAQVGGNLTGDIIAGNKTIINHIIQQAAKQLVTAPYKFLNSYDLCDRDIFFGRDAIIEELIGNFPRYKTLVINGRSGSGKTSLINAGLIPRLAENGYQYLSFRDYSDPLRQLRTYVAQNDLFKAYADQTTSLSQFLQTVTRQHKQHLVVIFDQFERFFVNVPAGLQAQFIQEIKACLEGDLTGAELDLVFALREDFFGRFSSDFETAIPDFRRQTDVFHLRPLTREEARAAIINPLRNVAHKIGYDQEFVDAVLLPGLIGESSSQNVIDPPHLQIVCNQLYQAALHRYAAELAAGDVVQIDRQLYESLGETKEILRTYLDEFIDRAAQQEAEGRNVLRSMLKFMVAATGTRKFVSLPELQRGLPDVEIEKVVGYLQTLQEERIIETRRQDDTTRYSLSHEVMVAKVQSWFDEREMERKRAQETLERGLAEWQNTQALLNEKQVGKIRQWLTGDPLSAEAEQLLTESQRACEARKHQEQEQERRIKLGKRVLGAVIAIALVIASVLTGWALRERAEAIKHQGHAETQQRLAEHKQQKAEEQARQALAIFEQHTAGQFADVLRQSGIRQFAGVPATVSQKEERLSQDLAQNYQQILTERAQPITKQNFQLLDDLAQRRQELLAQQRQLQADIQQAYPIYHQLKYPQPIVVPDLQARLQPGEVIVLYDVLPTQTGLWMIRRDEFDFVPLNITENDLRQEIDVFQAIQQSISAAYDARDLELPRIINATTYQTAQIGYTLYQHLFPESIRPFLAPAQTLYVIPTGPLRGFPFEALVVEPPHTGAPPHYVVQDYTIAYLSSASLFSTVREARLQRQTAAGREPLLAFENLPATTSEPLYKAVQQAGMALPENAVYAADRATRSNLLHLNDQGRLAQYRYLLFAAQCLAPETINRDQQPALILAQPETEGYLTMADIFGLRLNADLVVLAGGNSGQSHLGLVRAWMYAGTPSVVATFWKIDSNAARLIVSYLFQHLQEGQAPGAALRQAKRDLLRDAVEDEDLTLFQHPFFWAPFVLFGDAGGNP